MPCAHDDLRGKVLRSSTQGKCSVCDVDHLCEPKICNFQMTICCHEQVFGLQVSVRYFLLMQVLQCQYYLSHIKQSYIIGEEILLS